MIGFSISGTRRCAWSLDRDFCAQAHINGGKLSCVARSWIRFADHNIGTRCGSMICVPAFRLSCHLGGSTAGKICTEYLDVDVLVILIR
jgi:hypothetical protein